ncbi:MAG TPA: folate-binding protein [Stellaceae bacterium]|nr:folate-binding protein [Stellaceae bacterium]
MAALSWTLLDDRGALEIAGADRVAFLQGLVSNDVAKVAPARAVHAALLTAQGRYLHDFFIIASGERFLLDAESARLDDLRRRLSLYRLRAKVTLADARERFEIAAAWGDGAARALGLPDEAGAAGMAAGGIAYVDPRLEALGARLLVPKGQAQELGALGFAAAARVDYDRLRLALGVPDGSRDLAVEKALLVESGFDEMNGIDWQKGCYIGQEITARMKHRGLAKKRLVPVAVEGDLPPPDTPVLLGDEEAGELRSGRDGAALALLRLEAMEKAAATGAALSAGGAKLTPRKPAWAREPS